MAVLAPTLVVPCRGGVVVVVGGRGGGASRVPRCRSRDCGVLLVTLSPQEYAESFDVFWMVGSRLSSPEFRCKVRELTFRLVFGQL